MADHTVNVTWADIKPRHAIYQGKVVEVQHRINLATCKPETRLYLAEGGTWSGWSGWHSSDSVAVLVGEW
jgi:hypothetical protein